MGAETFYLAIVVILFMLAVADLVVGVSNDAVNFLISALGSKAAPYWLVMITASVGVMVGAIFSSGMMEVARKSIFNPDMFVFSEVMLIFLAVMLTDIILLDLFNTFGLPTSTTVSVVFELLGASVAIAAIKVSLSDDLALHLGDFINTEKALAIVGGILLSVVVAFVIGALVQYVARLLFSFGYERYNRWFGPIWGGLSISAITFFILLEGLEGSSIMTPERSLWVAEHTGTIMTYSLAGWTLLLFILHEAIKLNPLKVVVVMGTFALALAFAGNDLVNFIGVPLAGLRSYQEYVATGADPSQLTMTVLLEKVHTPTIYLLVAGLTMVLTLWFSKKARSVTETSINLSRQDSGYERFGATGFSRVLVRNAIRLGQGIAMVTPGPVKRFWNSRFDRATAIPYPKGQEPAFDLVRASVNLLVSSVLIASATSLKLPLSTTYVTFMVAMATSLSDGAWGRESAVYRVTGVVSVIGGWFVTALVAFTITFVFALLLHWQGHLMVALLSGLTFFSVVKSRLLHRKRQHKEELSREGGLAERINGSSDVFEACVSNIQDFVDKASGIYRANVEMLAKADRVELKRLYEQVADYDIQTKSLKNRIPETVARLADYAPTVSQHYVQMVDYLREITHSLEYIVQPSFEHINNNHRPLIAEQVEDLERLSQNVCSFFEEIREILLSQSFHRMSLLFDNRDQILLLLKELRESQVHRIKEDLVNTRNSVLYFNLLSESKNFVVYSLNLLKAERDFVMSKNV